MHTVLFPSVLGSHKLRFRPPDKIVEDGGGRAESGRE